jgi:hypothetical protein
MTGGTENRVEQERLFVLRWRFLGGQLRCKVHSEVPSPTGSGYVRGERFPLILEDFKHLQYSDHLQSDLRRRGPAVRSRIPRET